MYAQAVDPTEVSKNSDVDTEFTENAKVEEVFYWRKHHDLHGWMENLYREKGGEAESFNCCKVQLTSDDLDQLEKDVIADKLPKTQGFFFGNNPPDRESIEGDLLFIAKARSAIDQGKLVFYDSWW